VEAFSRCVVNEDITALTKVPGIGRKTAERLVIEMRDRLGDPAVPASAGVMSVAVGASPESEAYGALIALGYRPAEATRLLKAAGPGTHSTEELIRRALQGANRPEQ
jgi:Holliday junction DNA helicase RuvA